MTAAYSLGASSDSVSKIDCDVYASKGELT